MSELHHWANGDKNTDSVLVELLIVRQTVKHLSSTLRVPDVSKLLFPANLEGIVNFSCNVEVTHFFKIIIPSVKV